MPAQKARREAGRTRLRSALEGSQKNRLDYALFRCLERAPSIPMNPVAMSRRALHIYRRLNSLSSKMSHARDLLLEREMRRVGVK